MVKNLIIAAALLFGTLPADAADHAFGDSITYGVAASPLSSGYVPLLSTATGRSITNHGTSGDMVPDAATKVYPVTLGATERATIMLGVNDERIYGANATTLGYYRRGYQALIAYLALGTKQTGIACGGETAGTWTNTAVYGLGRNSNVNGSTKTCTVSGTTVYLGMIQQDGAPGTFDVKVDGVLAGSYSTLTVGLGPTVNGVTYGPMLIRLAGLAAGSHSVQIAVTSATNGASRVYLDWIAGSDQTIKPSVYVGNVLRAAAYTAGGSDANVAAYNAEVAALVAELQADGLNVFPVDASAAVNQTTDMDGGYHPVNAGHSKIEAAFYAAETGPPPPPPAWTWSGVNVYLGIPSGGGSTVYCAATSPPSGACPAGSILLH